jgi:hypothetical protein
VSADPSCLSTSDGAGGHIILETHPLVGDPGATWVLTRVLFNYGHDARGT